MPRALDGSPVRCPLCDVRLVEVQRQGVLIDACPECRGIWLDRGEVEKLVELEAYGPDHDAEEDFFAEVEGRKRPEAAVSTRPAPGKPSGAKEERKGGGRKRRGSSVLDLLEGVLDFD